MKIIDLLDDRSILLDGRVADKKAALDQMVELMDASGKLRDKETYRQGVYAREQEGSTGIGEGIAIPHCKSDAVIKPGLAAMVVKDGVEFESLDGQPAHLFFLIAAPNTEDNVHLDVLSRLSVLLMDEDFTNKLRQATSVSEFKQIIEEAEKGSENENDTVVEQSNSEHYIVAVTGCPTGIAHTYMAAEALEKKAKELGYSIKVETRGAGGAKNVLTTDEIERADGIIVAADTQVPMDRFQGKPTVVTKVADGINKPEELLREIVDGKAPLYEGGGETAPKEEAAEKEGIGHATYKHLMSGVSHMLPFVIGGGIMIAIAFLIDTLCGYGGTGGGNFGTCTPLSALFKYIGDFSMGLMVPVLAGYIAYSIADRPGLAVGFTGGLLAANGNAVLAKYVFANESLGGFSKFISNFAFVGENGGNTVSGFLGGIAAGFVAGFIVLGLKKLCSKLPDSLEGIKPTLIYPLVGIFLIGILMTMVFNPLIGLINTGLSNMLTSISDAGMITVLGLILGAMMAIDMGGPINKAAYVFGSGMLATASQMMAQGAQASDPAVQACYMAMASIMVGGMVPPVGIAAACKLFPRKFTKAEQGSAVSNIVMGCSFITEGAIPFAASDPLHVIPCTMAGAGVAGLLSALFGCTLMAPHGGVFVFATVGQPLLYIVAWLVGSAVTAVMLGFIKKDAKA
ncbi:fructose-specific PTS transporter subunit EIIC [Clostridium sp. AF36-4]|jgi:PTS system fructose-specific IIC component|uniref:PTS fructose transporter subunit IIABC n=1 Tax=Clostridium sp. AF36-4 TaxID=2293015 RepID=UPI000E3F06F1|nr:fructose-specific PTS transporter subunit EIIC [Clostridium sp. AF36-4]RGF57665.1 PTS fructose transporter subunit IIC [Clostridium sp. AF36-4]HBD41996.1 PTS fructose transporter subunit IIC [Lachnospiraceae bacterium]